FLSAAALALFAFGVVAAARARRQDTLRLFLPILAVALPPLVIFGSNRFLVPAIPEIALFQAYALVQIAGSAATRVTVGSGNCRNLQACLHPEERQELGGTSEGA